MYSLSPLEKNVSVSHSCSSEGGRHLHVDSEQSQLMNEMSVAGRDSGVAVRSVSGCQGLLVRSWEDTVQGNRSGGARNGSQEG